MKSATIIMAILLLAGVGVLVYTHFDRDAEEREAPAPGEEPVVTQPVTPPATFPGSAPTTVATTSQGLLVVTDTEEGAIYSYDGQSWEVIGEGRQHPRGVAGMSDGRTCAGHYTTADPLSRLTAVSCWDGNAWTQVGTSFGQGITDIAAVEEGLWIAAWVATPVESRNSRISLLTEGGVETQHEFIEMVPHSIALSPDGDLFVSVRFEDASGIRGGDIVRISQEGERSRVETDLSLPAGVAHSDHGLWVSDAWAGELVLISPEGERLASREGFVEPFGVTVWQNHVCVAEEGAGVVTCLPLDELL